MTTPIVEITPAVSPVYKYQFGDTVGAGFTNDVATLDASHAYDFMNGNRPLRIFIDTSGASYAGIFSGMPNTGVYKLVAANLCAVADDSVESVITDRVIVSNDGQIVFKPNFARLVNDVIPEIEEADKHYISIEVEAIPAYTNPSDATPAYQPTILKFIITLSNDIAIQAPYSPIDSNPYINYAPGTETQPAI